jgi:hypothetical protein
MNMNQRRPLEIRLRTLADVPDGFSEAAANVFGRTTADAVVLLKVLIDDGALHLQVASVQGANAEPVAPSALFHLWLSFTGVIARLEPSADNPELAAQIGFVRKMLMMMGFNADLGPLTQAQVLSELRASEQPSTPAEPTEQPDASHSSVDSASLPDQN